MVHPGTTNFGLVKIQTGKQTVRKSASFSQFHFFFSSTQQDLELGDNVRKQGENPNRQFIIIHKHVVQTHATKSQEHTSCCKVC